MRGSQEQVKKATSRDGTSIASWVSGSGPPLILVHGTISDHTRWNPVLPKLQNHFTVFAVDRRGRGESGDSAQYSIDREFEDIASVIDSVGKPANLVGHSYGGLCSLEAALLTKKISKLVLYEPPINPGLDLYPPGFIDKLQMLVDEGDREGVVVAFLREILRIPPKELEVMRSLPAWAGRVAAAHTVPRELNAQRHYKFDPKRFANLTTPILLLLGGDTPQFLKEATKVVNNALSHSQVSVMAGQAHGAGGVPGAGAELFANEVTRFFNVGAT